jgi:hypothetical protein
MGVKGPIKPVIKFYRLAVAFSWRQIECEILLNRTSNEFLFKTLFHKVLKRNSLDVRFNSPHSIFPYGATWYACIVVMDISLLSSIAIQSPCFRGISHLARFLWEIEFSSRFITQLSILDWSQSHFFFVWYLVCFSLRYYYLVLMGRSPLFSPSFCESGSVTI